MQPSRDIFFTVEREEGGDFKPSAEVMKVVFPALSPPTMAMVIRQSSDLPPVIA